MAGICGRVGEKVCTQLGHCLCVIKAPPSPLQHVIYRKALLGVLHDITWAAPCWRKHLVVSLQLMSESHRVSAYSADLKKTLVVISLPRMERLVMCKLITDICGPDIEAALNPEDH